MANNSETVTLKLPSGEEVDVVVPAGMADDQVSALMQKKHPDLFPPPNFNPSRPNTPKLAPNPAPDNRSLLEKASTQPSQFSHINPLRYFDELGQGMAQGAEMIAHPIDTAKKAYQFATTPIEHDPSGDKPLLQGLGDVADTAAQSWGQAATIGPPTALAARTLTPAAETQPGLPSIKPETVPAKALARVWSGERTGLPYKPDPRYTPPNPLPARSGPLLLNAAPEEGLPAIYRDATLNKRNIPDFAGEEEAAAPQSLRPLGAQSPRGRMGPPLRPNVFASPEEAQIYDNQMTRLGAEAKDAGMYSAARGAVKRIPDYQERIGRTMRQLGEPPVNLMEEEETTPPVRPRKVENE